MRVGRESDVSMYSGVASRYLSLAILCVGLASFHEIKEVDFDHRRI